MMKGPRIRLEAQNLHWISDNQATDLCAHGNVIFEIGNQVIVDPSSGDWCVSAAALYLLRTLTNDHTGSHPVSEHLIPCCGHSMFAAKDSEDVFLFGCSNGINWDVIHQNENIILEFDDQKTVTVSRAEWFAAVYSFSDQVGLFYDKSEPKQPYDETEADGFRAFRNEWKRRRSEVL